MANASVLDLLVIFTGKPYGYSWNWQSTSLRKNYQGIDEIDSIMSTRIEHVLLFDAEKLVSWQAGAKHVFF